MKIEILYTLSQFVGELLKDSTEENIKDEWWLSSAFQYVVVYLKFLTQPLKKEMFVNEFGKNEPQLGTVHQQEFESHLGAWQEAEKKVIFKEWECYNNQINNNSIDWYVKFDKYIIHHHTDNTFTLYISGISKDWTIDSIHDLAEATNGELKLKNVEL